MMKHSQLFRYLAYTLEIVFLLILQDAPGVIPEIHFARPLLLIPAAVTIAMFEPQTPAMTFGILCGLLTDAGMDSGILGLHAMILALVCFTVSYLARDLLQTNVITAFTVCCIAMGVTVLLQWLLDYVALGYADPGYALLQHYLPRFVYTVVLVFPIYALNRLLALRIQPPVV
ncbi:MAG: rod shape-determining protein MreD [Oscillospiraceae bacterium]|jgi:rod shape-determining protein MreD|nr:rod shape-determining protein MreD [Oscillospiraceae bacterium]